MAQTVDRVIIMHGGAIRFAGSLDELSEPGFPALEAAYLRLTGDQISEGSRP